MISSLKYKLKRHGAGQAKIISIVGNGRSGTHYLTKLIAKNPDITDLNNGRENGYIFKLMQNVATGEKTELSEKEKIIQRYNKLKTLSDKKYIVDQTHIAHWLSEELILQLDIKLLGLVRNPFAVAASAIKHKGAAGWDLRARNKRFYGGDLIGYDQEKPIELRLLYRWYANIERLTYLKDVLIIKYEDLQNDRERTLSRIEERYQLKKFQITSDFDDQSLTKYKKELKNLREMRLELKRIAKNNDANQIINKYIEGYIDE